MAKIKTETRILNRINDCHGAISVGLLASDLRLSASTVRRYVDRLKEEGRVEDNPAGGLLLTAAEVRERAVDARVKTHR